MSSSRCPLRSLYPLRCFKLDKCLLCARPVTLFQNSSLTDYSHFAPPLPSKKNELLQRYKQTKTKTQKERSIYKQLISNVESIAAQRFLTSNIQQFSSLARAKQENKTRGHQSAREATTSANSIVLPFHAYPNPTIFTEKEAPTEHGEQMLSGETPEKGYFVQEDSFKDAYSVGTTADLPEDEMTESPYQYFGDLEKAVEHIEFQLPGQASSHGESIKTIESDRRTGNSSRQEFKDIGDWMSNYSTVQPKEEDIAEMRLLDAKCAGCGANFHWHNPSIPGFVPYELYREIEYNSKKSLSSQKTDFICRRCYLLKEYDFLLNLNVSPVDYASIMGHLKLVQEALILLIIDMTDLESSIHQQLPSIIGSNKPMIVIGNKIDLLPPDAMRGYLRHYLSCLKDALHRAGFTEKFNILKFLLVSAKTGFGVEDLITNIYQKWLSPRQTLRSDIYMVGSTNAGKSTLFNAFLQSDLCKVRAKDLVERVTTSIWPGTTLSLLKFPIMSPSLTHLEIRRRRLLAMQAWKKKEELMRKSLYQKTRNARYLTLQGIIGNSFDEYEAQKQPVSVGQTIKYFTGELDNIEEIQRIEGVDSKKPGMTLNDITFRRGRWCYDTPGTVNSQQTLDLFTLEELINVVPRSIILPRIFALHPQQTLLIGGVARLDILEVDTARVHSPPVFVTVFSSKGLKLNVMKTVHVDGFLKEFCGDPSLGAPIGGPERLEKFPQLKSVNFEVENEEGTVEFGFADVVFSSIGWALLTSEAKGVNLRAWTPAGRGLYLRQPPLLPYAADYRNKRIADTAEYTNRPLEDIETFSETQRSVKPKKVVGRNLHVETDQPAQYVSFDLD